ncbi:hypothetical protein INR49_032578, partial [Caranx melampygus]
FVPVAGPSISCLDLLVGGGEAGRPPTHTPPHPTTPLKCVNEKERGQEESAGSTAEVLTEGIEGLRLHLFRPSTLPAGLHQSLSLLLASVMGARGQSHLQRSLHLFFPCGKETRNARGSICRGLAVVSAARLGKGVAGPPRLCHGGLTVVDHSEAHHTTTQAEWDEYDVDDPAGLEATGTSGARRYSRLPAETS